MKKLLVVFTLILAVIYSYESSAKSPKVTLKYGETFDWVCSNKTGYEVKPEWVSELSSRFHEFQTEWNSNGQILLEKSAEIVGKSFQQNDFIVNLTLCNFPSMSSPLLINTRYALKSFTKKPIAVHVSISIIHHEILHVYLENQIPTDSRLLSKYSGEHPRIKSHIHLQKATYLYLGWTDKLKEVIAKDYSLPGGYYKKAWEIVDTEGHKVFVEELAQ